MKIAINVLDRKYVVMNVSRMGHVWLWEREIHIWNLHQKQSFIYKSPPPPIKVINRLFTKINSQKEIIHIVIIYLFIFQKKTPSISYKILQMRLVCTNPWRDAIVPSYVDAH